jgi:hypothetical protein
MFSLQREFKNAPVTCQVSTAKESSYWKDTRRSTKPLRGGGNGAVIGRFAVIHPAAILSTLFSLTWSLNAVMASVNQIHSRRQSWESYSDRMIEEMNITTADDGTGDNSFLLGSRPNPLIF